MNDGSLRSGLGRLAFADIDIGLFHGRFEIRDHATCRARGLAVQGFAPVEIGGTGATVRFGMP